MPHPPLWPGNWGPLNDVLTRLDGNVYNVKDDQFAGGAKGDNATDDTASIQEAIDAANAAGRGIVFLPPGTYICGQVTLRSNVTILGAGRGVTTIKVKTGTNNHWMNTSITSLSEVHMRSFTLDGNKANNSSGSGFNFILYTKSSVRDCRIFNTAQQAIQFFQATECFAEGNDVETTGSVATQNGTQAGISLNGAVRCRVIGNRIDGTKDSGIICLNSAERCLIANNTVKSCTFIGIALSGGNHLAVVGNTVDSTTDDGIDGGNSQHTTISGNAIYNCAQGISCDGGNYVTMVGNTIDTTTRTDVGLLGNGIIFVNGSAPSKGVVCIGNVISFSAGHGIAYDNIQGGVIANNLIRNSAILIPGDNGINITSTHADGSKNIVVSGNRCYDDQAGKTQAYGLNVTGTNTQSITVMDNDFTGNLTGALNMNATTGNQVGDNLGYKTRAVKALTYSASIATDASYGDVFTIIATNGTAFTIANPTLLQPDMVVTYDIKNSSGGAHGVITWGSTFLNGGAGTVGTGAFTGIANGKRRTISFYYDGTNLIELSRTTDI